MEIVLVRVLYVDGLFIDKYKRFFMLQKVNADWAN